MKTEIELEDIVFDTNNFERVKKIIEEHTLFLKDITRRLNILSEANPEIFRRKPESRVKTLSSIVRKLNDDKVSKKNAIKRIIDYIEDIGGIRLTIATQDYYSDAGILLKKSLRNYGTVVPKKSWRGVENDSGYCADHYIVRSNANPEIKIEIQVRTLTHDLWAVFTHYESYKANDKIENSRAEELLNYSRLMDVADYYAKLIRERKVEDANELHKKNTPSVFHKRILTVRILQDLLYKINISELKRKEIPRVSKKEIIQLCDLLKELASFQVYTVEDFNEVVSNIKFKSALKEIINQVNSEKDCEHQMEILDAFMVFVKCRNSHKKDFKEKKVSPRLKSVIKGYVSEWKLTMLANDKINELKFENDNKD